MTQDSNDLIDPIDALNRLIQAIDEQRAELDREDLHALSGLQSGYEEQIGGCIDALDDADCFALLGSLQEAMEEGGGFEFTSVFVAALGRSALAVRQLAAAGLGRCETPAATAALLTAAVESGDDTVRGEAIDGLGNVALRLELGWAGLEGADKVVETLRAFAKDVREAPSIRATAIAAVAVVHEDWAAELIEDAYISDEPALRLGAICAMGRNADPIWLPQLEIALFGEDPGERVAAASATVEIGVEDAVPMLLDLLDQDDSDLDVTLSVVQALGGIGGDEALERLTQLRTHPDEQLRNAAHNAIEDAALRDDTFSVCTEPPDSLFDHAQPRRSE